MATFFRRGSSVFHKPQSQAYQGFAQLFDIVFKPFFRPVEKLLKFSAFFPQFTNYSSDSDKFVSGKSILTFPERVLACLPDDLF